MAAHMAKRSASIDQQNSLANHVAIEHVAQRARTISQRILRAYARPQGTGFRALTQRVPHRQGLLGPSTGKLASINANDLAALQQREVERNAGNVAGRQSADEKPAFPGNGAHFQVFPIAADGCVCAERGACGQFVVSTGALTRMRTWLGPGAGIAWSIQCNDSGAPYSLHTKAFI